MNSLLKSAYEKLEIIVVDDGSTDNTFLRLNEAFSNNQKVRIFSISNCGKSNALNYGISRSKADIVITLDADTIFTPETVKRLVDSFQDDRVGAVAGNAKVGNRINSLTRCQALEYISGQNLERRTYDLMNCISVVPGAIGAWRREVITAAGGFSDETLAEDADLTFDVIRSGYRVTFREDAVALTEAPDTVKNFIKQRVRWTYGTLQTVWKHRRILFRRKYGAIGFFTIPNVYIFQLLFPILAPFLELTILLNLGWSFWQTFHHLSGEYSSLLCPLSPDRFTDLPHRLSP